MTILILSIFFAVYSVLVSNGQVPVNVPDDCLIIDVKGSYRHSSYQLIINSYKSVARLSNLNFVFSPASLWIMLAAIAEGSDQKTKENLFRILGLPEDPCIRQKYYEVATTRAIPVTGVNVVQTHALLVDEGLTINPAWYNFVSKNSLLDVVTAPIKNNPIATANEIKRVMAVNVPRLNLTGNSVLLDSTDYNGLWATAFADAVIERAPFYSLEGKEIGAVDLMKVKRKARMGHMKRIGCKVLELPFGSDNHYRMIFIALIEGNDYSTIVAGINNNILYEMFESLKESNVPLDIAIPRIGITGEVDMRTILEDVGVKSIWTDPEATKYISSPPALPSSYVQRASVILDKYGVTETPVDQYPPPGAPTGLDPEIGTAFIANQPFLFGLFEVDTYTPLVSVAFTKPTYS